MVPKFGANPGGVSAGEGMGLGRRGTHDITDQLCLQLSPLEYEPLAQNPDSREQLSHSFFPT